MRKKLMSLIVAAAFVLSIASPAAFAAPSSAGTAATAQSNSSGVLKDSGDLVVTPDNTSIEDEDQEATKIYSRFTNVFNYSSGVLVSVTDATGGFTLFEGGQARVSFTKNENGTYAMSAFNFRPGDIDIINNMRGETGAERIKNFLTAIGAGNMLKVEKPEVDENGNAQVWDDPEKYADRAIEEVDIAWFQTLYDHLSKGINYGASIDFQAAGGAQLTTTINGQAIYTYGAASTNNQPVVVKEYFYDAGFLVGIKDLAYKVDLTSIKEGYEEVYKDLKEDKDKNYTQDELSAIRNQTHGTAKFNKTYTYTTIGAYGQPSFISDASGNVLQEYFYSNTGTIQSMKDRVTNNINYFVNGKFDYSVNAEGFVTARMFRFQNGLSDCIINYNNGVATSMNVFYNDQLAITLSMVNGQIMDANMARELYKTFKDPNFASAQTFINKYITDAATKQKVEEDMQNDIIRQEKIDKEGSTDHSSPSVRQQYAYINAMISLFGVTSFSVYAQDLNNKAILRVLGLDERFEIKLMEQQEKEADAELAKLNAREAEMKNIWNSLDAAEKEKLKSLEEIKADDEKSDEQLKDAQKQTTLSDLSPEAQDFATWKTAKIEFTNQKNRNNKENRDAASKSIKKALELMRKFNNGASAVLQSSFSVSETDYRKDYSKEYYENGQKIDNATAEGEIKKDGTSTGNGQGTVTHTYEVREKWTKVENTILSINLSINTYGQARVGYTADHTIRHVETQETNNYNKTVTYHVNVNNSDPVIIGTQGGFVGSDGKALVNADGTAMTNEQIAEFIANGGVVYVSVNANDVNIMDGQGFQAVDGEEILVQVTDVDVFNELADNVGKQVMLMGDVTNDVDGKKAIVMNLSYGGGYQVGTGVTAMKEIIEKIEAGDTSLSAQNAWVQQNLDANSWLSGVSGSLDAKWNLLIINGNSGGALEKTPRALLQIMAAVLAVF